MAPLLKQTRPDLLVLEIRDRLKKTGKWVFDDPSSRWTPRVDARVAFLVDDAADFDQDGCSDSEEFGPSEMLGGRRDHLWYWDFYDVPLGVPGVRDQAIDGFDISAVVACFGMVRPGGDPTKAQAIAEALTPQTNTNGYHAASDRDAPIVGLNLWNHGQASRNIDAFDIGGVVSAFGHTCAAAP